MSDAIVTWDYAAAGLQTPTLRFRLKGGRLQQLWHTNFDDWRWRDVPVVSEDAPDVE